MEKDHGRAPGPVRLPDLVPFGLGDECPARVHVLPFPDREEVLTMGTGLTGDLAVRREAQACLTSYLLSGQQHQETNPNAFRMSSKTEQPLVERTWPRGGSSRGRVLSRWLGLVDEHPHDHAEVVRRPQRGVGVGAVEGIFAHQVA